MAKNNVKIKTQQSEESTVIISVILKILGTNPRKCHCILRLIKEYRSIIVYMRTSYVFRNVSFACTKQPIPRREKPHTYR